jgi:hypothetical protein
MRFRSVNMNELATTITARSPPASEKARAKSFAPRTPTV